MKNLILLIVHLVTTVARLLRPGGTKTVLAETLLLKHQLLIVNRSRQRAPNLNAFGQDYAGPLDALYESTPNCQKRGHSTDIDAFAIPPSSR